ncbi:hypothetical protein AC244_16010 [Ensifer adhaerens]|uniref:Uncharacterized protein n=1 Tax=Ensifer adhaerens TaxID=106592 RepID=A0A0L8BTM3_ENSAD|nr:hypothetical protein [Ensifer adhaerens]KOF17869.1 hypothetical protein AC244_16010 [Ensifer adhaerens]
MRWFGPATIVVVFSVIIFGDPKADFGFCTGNPEEHCFREWVSATSGWFAGVAAFISIALLARQVKDAQMQYQSAEMQRLEAQANIARQIINAVAAVRITIDARRRELGKLKADPADTRALNRCLGVMETGINDFSRRAFDDFEAITWPGHLDIQQVRSGMKANLNYMKTVRDMALKQTPDWRQWIDDMLVTIGDTGIEHQSIYCNQLELLANEMITRWSTAVAGRSNR